MANSTSLCYGLENVKACETRKYVTLLIQKEVFVMGVPLLCISLSIITVL